MVSTTLAQLVNNALGVRDSLSTLNLLPANDAEQTALVADIGNIAARITNLLASELAQED